MAQRAGLTEPEILALVNDYIGGQEGYLEGFTHASYREFYPYFCGLTVDVEAFRANHGTIRKAFIAVLRESEPAAQAKIVEGTFKKLPLEGFPEPARETKAAARRKLELVLPRLRGGPPVASDELAHQSDAVDRAIRDATTLLAERGTTSGVDRIHTALHGYLLTLCRVNNIPTPKEPDLPQAFKALRAHHPSFQLTHTRVSDLNLVLNAAAQILHALNPLRNRASLAHPNEELLAEDEAALVIDAARTILNYMNRKLR